MHLFFQAVFMEALQILSPKHKQISNLIQRLLKNIMVQPICTFFMIRITHKTAISNEHLRSPVRIYSCVRNIGQLYERKSKRQHMKDSN